MENQEITPDRMGPPSRIFVISVFIALLLFLYFFVSSEALLVISVIFLLITLIYFKLGDKLRNVKLNNFTKYILKPGYVLAILSSIALISVLIESREGTTNAGFGAIVVLLAILPPLILLVSGLIWGLRESTTNTPRWSALTVVLVIGILLFSFLSYLGGL